MTHSYADHPWFAFRDRASTPAPRWDTPRDVSVHLIVSVQAFPLEFKTPFAIPGGLDRPYPDISNWTQRHVGLREGLERVLDLLDDVGLPATFALDADACAETESLHRRLLQPRHGIAAAGQNASCLHAAYSEPEPEAAMVTRSLERLASLGFKTRAWHPPAGVHSPRTMDILADSGVRTLLDFNNDEVPFRIRVPQGELLCVPWQHFAGDLHCLQVCRQATPDYIADIGQGIAWLGREAKDRGPRLLTLPIHPWIIGVPHRLREFAAGVRAWAAKPDVRFVSLRDIEAAYSGAV